MSWLEGLADLATIATAFVAVWAYGSYRLKIRDRRIAVESLLASKNQPSDDTLLLSQIAAELKLTVEQVVEAAQASNRIEGSVGQYGHERRLKYIRRNLPGEGKMNWKLGLFRIWVVASAAWTIFAFTMTVNNMNANAPSFGWSLDYWKLPLLNMCAPWLLTALVSGLVWAYDGLKTK